MIISEVGKWNVEDRTTEILPLEDQLPHLHLWIEWHAGPSFLTLILTLVPLPVYSLLFIYSSFLSLRPPLSISIFLFHMYSFRAAENGELGELVWGYGISFSTLYPPAFTSMHTAHAITLQIKMKKISHTFVVCSNLLIRISISEKTIKFLQ